jgi:hypothetical protein
MSTTINFTTVTNAIEALSIAGVTVLDIDEIPDTLGLDNHVLAPMPAGFVSNFAITRDEQSAQLLTLDYTLTYRYYHTRIAGGLGGLFATYSGLVANAAAILLACASKTVLSGALDSGMPSIANMGPVTDPSGNAYHGFDVIFQIKQFLEV